jgi:hypothetical protein
MHVLETPNSFCLEFWAIIVVPDKYLYFKPRNSLYKNTYHWRVNIIKAIVANMLGRYLQMMYASQLKM